MQDEVHRFAISFHKELRNKKMTKSILDDVHGLGRKRREILEKAFGDIEGIKKASLEELKQYIPENVALELLKVLNI
jgi:excinuclease ABC subunit C